MKKEERIFFILKNDSFIEMMSGKKTKDLVLVGIVYLFCLMLALFLSWLKMYSYAAKETAFFTFILILPTVNQLIFKTLLVNNILSWLLVAIGGISLFYVHDLFPVSIAAPFFFWGYGLALIWREILLRKKGT